MISVPFASLNLDFVSDCAPRQSHESDGAHAPEDEQEIVLDFVMELVQKMQEVRLPKL